MRFVLFVLFIIFLSSAVFSQKTSEIKGRTRIIGEVLDSASGLALEYASVSILAIATDKVLREASSNKSGHFELDEIPGGQYKIQIAFIGYSQRTIDSITITGKVETVNLNQLWLAKNFTTLQAVSISSGKLVENKIDKLVYNAENDISAQTGVATDILKKVPMVSVDIDGNVELAGSSAIRFLINGKPSTIFGNNIADVLQSIPASQIKSIEIITNPGAKYDAQGLGGIINIILKKSNLQGINSSLSLSLGTRNENGSLNLNAKKGRFGVNAFFSGNARLKAKTPFTSQRESYDSISKSFFSIIQDGSSDISRHGIQTGIGFEAEVDKRNSFTGGITFNSFGFQGSGSFDQTQVIRTSEPPGDVVTEIRTINNNSNSFSEKNTDANFGYRRTFDKEDQELEIGVNSSFANNHNQSASQQYLLPGNTMSYASDGTGLGKEKLNEFTVDYKQPFSETIKWGVGAKLSLYDIASNSDVFGFNHDLKEYQYDSSLSISLDYHQKVYAGYSEISFSAGKLFDVKGGGRFEETITRSYYSNADSQVQVPSYGTFVPSLLLSRKLNDKETIKLGYSKRIERPDYEELNPFINTSDPNNISMGNPHLKPEISHRIELSYSRNLSNGSSIMATLFHRINKNDIQPFVVYYPSLIIGDSTYYNVYVTSRQNIGTERNTGMNLFGDFHTSDRISVRSNLFFFYRNTRNEVDTGYDSQSFNYRFNVNLTYQLSTTWLGEFFGNFNSPRHEAQGKYPSFISYTLAIRKKFWNRKASFALTATNFLTEYVKQKTELTGPGFVAETIRNVPFRSFGINFTWKFGRLEFKKDNEEVNNNLNAPGE